MSDQSKIVLRGRIKQIFPAEIIGSFEKRVMWLEETEEEQYPQCWPLEFHQGAVNDLDAFKEGDMVTCSINLRGRHWRKDGREGAITTLQCWRIVRQGTKPQPAMPPAPSLNVDLSEGGGDDLPF